MAIGTGSDPLSGAPDAGVRGRAAFGAPAPSFAPSAPAIISLPDTFADYNQDFMAVPMAAGPSAVSFPLQDPVGGSYDHPWKVRWHEDKDGNRGQWEVLSPSGNFEGIGVCEVINDKATETSGHTLETDSGWYKLGVGGALNDGDYKVVAHFKAAAKFGAKPYRRPAVFVGIMDAGDDPEDDASTYAGDYASVLVATIHVKTDDKTGDVVQSATQILKTPYTVSMATIGAPCVLGVDCSVSGSTLRASKFGFESENVTAAGASGTVSLDLSLGEACSIWLHVTVANGETKFELKKLAPESSPVAQYSDTDMYICLYRISDYGTVVGDFRANLQNVPYYR